MPDSDLEDLKRATLPLWAGKAPTGAQPSAPGSSVRRAPRFRPGTSVLSAFAGRGGEHAAGPSAAALKLSLTPVLPFRPTAGRRCAIFRNLSMGMMR